MIVDTVQSVQEGVSEIIDQQRALVASLEKDELSRVAEQRSRLADALSSDHTATDVSIDLLSQDIAGYQSSVEYRATSANDASIENVEALRVETLDLIAQFASEQVAREASESEKAYELKQMIIE